MVSGGMGFQPGGQGFLIAGVLNKNTGFDNSMDDDGEIRPSQIDEFIDKKENNNNKAHSAAAMGITSSYISIGEDDPFLTGRFQDATTKQFNFKPNSNLIPPEMKQSQ